MIAIQSMDLVLLGLFFDRVSGFFGILELAMPPLRILKDSCDLSVANQDSLRSLETLLRPCGTSMLENIFIAGISDHGGCSGDALGMLWGCSGDAFRSCVVCGNRLWNRLTAVCALMCVQPTILAPFNGRSSLALFLRAIIPGISASMQIR